MYQMYGGTHARVRRQQLERRESRFTFPSPVLCALHRALDPYSTPSGRKKRHAHYARLGQHVREKLRELGIKRLAPESVASPVITTFEPPGSCDVRTSCTRVLEQHRYGHGPSTWSA